ncbi:MAG: hypothetical protein ACREFP_02765 [Acetobacteraceae bacterium]
MEYEELEFVIPAYTPETMPLDRLLQYLEQVGEVIGFVHDLHLVRIEASSTTPIFQVPAPIATQARDRAAAVRTGRGTRAQRSAYDRIREMVRSDGGKSASLKDRKGVILDFPPVPDVAPIIGVRQSTTFDGFLLRVGGRGDYTPILMQDLAGDVFAGFSAPRNLAKAMASFLFEPLRVNGIGSWDRSRAGEWKLTKMLIQTYERLKGDDFNEVLRQLRAAQVMWPDDIDRRLETEREPAV